MMREIEKVFENMKEEFNKKISSDSFMSYFATQDNVSEGELTSESFEDITMDNKIPRISIDDRSSLGQDSLQMESLDPPPISDSVFDNDSAEVIDTTSVIIIESAENYHELTSLKDIEIVVDVQPDVVEENTESNGKDNIVEELIEFDSENFVEVIDDTMNNVRINIVQSDEEENLQIVNEKAAFNDETSVSLVTEIIRINSSERPLKVIDEEDASEDTAELINEDPSNLVHDTDIKDHTEYSAQKSNDDYSEEIFDSVIMEEIDHIQLKKTCEDISELYIEILNEDEVKAKVLTNGNQNNFYTKMESINEFFPSVGDEFEDLDNSKEQHNNNDTECNIGLYTLDTDSTNQIDTRENDDPSTTSEPLNHEVAQQTSVFIATDIQQVDDVYNLPDNSNHHGVPKTLNIFPAESEANNDSNISSKVASPYETEKTGDSIPTNISSSKRLNGPEVPKTPERFKKQRQQRMMWSEMSEVIESGILQTLPKKQIQLQEAMFEIITSEASYYQSLMILTTHFFESAPFKIQDDKDDLLSNTDRHHIFSNILLITHTSFMFSNDLDERWREQRPLLKEICDIILTHAQSDGFQNYVTYLRNQEYQTKALKRLSENETFKQQLNKLEMSSVCGKLSMDSYLMLPMQRLTRLKLLVDTLLKVMYSEELKDVIQEDHINTAEMASLKLKMLLDTSDNEKGIMDQKSMLMLLINKMDFPQNFKRISLSNKTFIKEDEVRVHQQNPAKYIRKFSKKRQPTVSLILFNDLLIVAKTKNTRLLVIDYCERCNLEVTDTKYKSIVSSADVSNTTSVDFEDESEDNQKSSLNSLVRSKSSLPPEELKRFSSSFTSSFRSLSLVNRIEEQDIINNSFSIKFLKGQTDIFSVPIAVLAKNKMDRDEWMTLLMNVTITDGRLHKTTSLKHSAITKEDFGINKSQTCYAKRKDD